MRHVSGRCLQIKWLHYVGLLERAVSDSLASTQGGGPSFQNERNDPRLDVGPNVGNPRPGFRSDVERSFSVDAHREKDDMAQNSGVGLRATSDASVADHILRYSS